VNKGAQISIPLTRANQDSWFEWAGCSRPESNEQAVIMLFGIAYLSSRRENMSQEDFKNMINGTASFLERKNKTT
jgi:hypothetical protein